MTALDEAHARAIIMAARHKPKPTPSRRRRNLLRLLMPWPMASVLFFG